MNPKEIKEYLDTYIEGQEDAKKAAAVMVYNHMRGIKGNIIFIGPSGCGKTEIFRVLKQLFPRSIYIYDASMITNDGWNGSKKFNSVFQDLRQSGYQQNEIENMIIVFDEFDKLCAPMYSSHGDNVHASIQSELLTMIEGSLVPMGRNEGPAVNTSHVSFAFCGAFEDVFKKKMQQKKKSVPMGFTNKQETVQDTPVTMEDLIKYGMRTEIAGRINGLVQLSALDRDQVKNLLFHPVRSPFAKLSALYQCSIQVEDEYINYLLDVSQDDARGVRAISSLIREELNKEVYEAGSSKKLTLIPLDKEEDSAPGSEDYTR